MLINEIADVEIALERKAIEGDAHPRDGAVQLRRSVLRQELLLLCRKLEVFLKADLGTSADPLGAQGSGAPRRRLPIQHREERVSETLRQALAGWALSDGSQPMQAPNASTGPIGNRYNPTVPDLAPLDPVGVSMPRGAGSRRKGVLIGLVVALLLLAPTVFAILADSRAVQPGVTSAAAATPAVPETNFRTPTIGALQPADLAIVRPTATAVEALFVLGSPPENAGRAPSLEEVPRSTVVLPDPEIDADDPVPSIAEGTSDLASDPPSAVGTAVVQISGFRGVQLRVSPSTSSPLLGLILNGTEIVVLEGSATADRFRWSLIRTPSGQVGWVVATALRRTG